MKEMNFYFDARWTRTDYHDGISRYTSGLLEGFLALDLPVVALICDERQLTLLPKGIRYKKINRPVSFSELFVAKKLNALGADVVFSPLQVMGFWGRRYRLILTLQDVIYYRHPKPPTNLPWYIRTVWRLFHMARWPQRLLLDRADHVATVSHTSRRFIEEMSLTKRPIDVIYNATSTAITTENRAIQVTKNIIYMGSFMPYKNVETLIRMMKLLPNEYTLLLLSKVHPERQAELERLVPDNASVVFKNGVTEDEYATLLRGAHCLATASKEEGFGLPVVEAQTYGTPVVCTDMDIFHEVAGEGALFCDPDQPEAFAEAIRSLEHPAIRAECIKKGHQQAATFSWISSARALYTLAESLYKRP